jgi:hypothetical protein
MSLQIIQDGNGKATGVFIPIKEWNKLKKQHKILESLEEKEPGKDQLLSELKQAFHELKLVNEGKLKARSAQELLDEL